eukprot:12898385-Heterocapsa_arctica.AAC.1
MRESGIGIRVLAAHAVQARVQLQRAAPTVAWRFIGLPSDITAAEVRSTCHAFDWAVEVDATSRRHSAVGSSWIIRTQAEWIPPPSTFV